MAAYSILHGRETGDSGKQKMVVGSAEPLRGQREEGNVGGATENVDPW